MRHAAIVLIVVALGVLGVILFAQARNISSQPRDTSSGRETANKKILSSPAAKTSPTTPDSTPVEAVSGSISWERNLARATETAKAEDKVIVVDVYTDWCGWCKRMDETIYSNPRIVGLSRQEVFLKLDAEDGGQGESFARKMKVKGYPTTIILDSDGERITERRGFIASPDQFIQFVEGARSKRSG